MNLRTLSDAELLRHAQVDFDPITGTALEAELLRRFEEHAAEGAPLLAVLEDLGYEEGGDLRKVLDAIGDRDAAQLGDTFALAAVLAEFDVDDPATLKTILECNAKLGSALDDLADPLAALQQLITQEA